MGTPITPPAKIVTGVYDEAWRTNIEGTPLTDPKVTCHRQEVTYYDDGTYTTSSEDGKTSEDFVGQVEFTMGEIVARTDDVAYTDKDGNAKTIPAHEIPFVVKALIDLLGVEARAAKLAELQAEE